MTAFGIFWGTAILAMLIGGSKGLKSFMSRNFEGFATNVAIVFPGRTTKPYAGFNKGMELELNLQDIINIRRAIPEIENSSAVNNLWANALYGQKSSNAMLTGVESGYDKIFVPVMYEGRFINEADNTRSRKVCVVGKKVADEIFGTESGLGKEISLNGIYYKVVGIAGQTSEISMGAELDESVIIPYNSMRANYNLGTKVGMFMMTLKSGYAPGDYENTVRRLIARNHPVAPDDEGAMYFFDVSEQFKMVDNIFLGITLLALVVGAGTLLSGIIGVGNIMWRKTSRHNYPDTLGEYGADHNRRSGRNLFCHHSACHSRTCFCRRTRCHRISALVHAGGLHPCHIPCAWHCGRTYSGYQGNENKAD